MSTSQLFQIKKKVQKKVHLFEKGVDWIFLFASRNIWTLNLWERSCKLQSKKFTLFLNLIELQGVALETSRLYWSTFPIINPTFYKYGACGVLG